MTVLAEFEAEVYGELGTYAIAHVGEYANGRPALVILNVNGQQEGVFSVNMPDVELAPGEFTVKTWSENEPFVKPIFATGVFKDTGKYVPSGQVKVPIWKMVLSVNGGE